MYLFKPFWYGGVVVALCNLHSTMYLFKPQRCLCKSAYNFFIYIPPCIYLNRMYSAYAYYSCFDLHSTMYLFKRIFRPRLDWRRIYLHSTMYLFKPHARQAQERMYHDLHSTMYLFKPGMYCCPTNQPQLFTFHHVSI